MGFLEKRIKEQLIDTGTYRELPVLHGKNDGTVILEGKEMVNVCSNIYLGLANHPRLKEAAHKAIDTYGVGSGAVRTISGNMDLHEELDRAIAKFKHEPAAVAFQSGYACNVGALQAFVEKDDVVFTDELNHASIIDGLRMTKAKKFIYKSCDMKHLEELIKEHRGQYKNAFIISDGVFSMDGNLAPLPELVKIAKAHDCLTYVDDAHGSGTMGSHGRGTVDHFGLHGQIDFIVGTLSKAVGVVGGYVTCSLEARQWLLHRGRPLLFSTSQPPMVIAACIEALKVMTESDELSKKLWENANYFKAGIAKLGFNLIESESPITPVVIGAEDKSLQFSNNLRKNGVFSAPIIFPTVPKGTGRIRCMLSASHTKANLDTALAAFEKVGKEMGII